MTRRTAAELYDAHLGDVLFTPAAEVVVSSALVKPDEDVLDLACGTGRVTSQLVAKIGPNGYLAALDVSEDMLAVAKSSHGLRDANIDWRVGDALNLPFVDMAFDLVVCQQSLQFFPDRFSAALEVMRVLKPGGRFVASTWMGLDRQPVEGQLRPLIAEKLDVDLDDAAKPFSLGSEDQLREVLEESGFRSIEIFPHELIARFASATDFVEMQFRVGAATMPSYATLAESEILQIICQLKTRMAPTLARFTKPDGALSFPQPTNVAIAWKE